MGIAGNADMARLEPETIADRVLAAARGVAADVCFISCTAIRSAVVIDALETALAMPVITSNQALAWYATRRLGLADTPPGFGRLFALPSMMKDAA